MKKDNLFVSFLILTEMYFMENDQIDFYANKLGRHYFRRVAPIDRQIRRQEF